MGYTGKHNELKSIFNPGLREISIPRSEMKIMNELFSSDFASDKFSIESDRMIEENNSFTYPVFVPADRNSRKVILLLHGLNERSWIKYLSWAYYLSLNTGSYVILFPISFHINRSPVLWSDPRAMIPFVKERRSIFGETEMASFANIALSNRLTEDPMRFFNSGYRTVRDLVQLMSMIRDGSHPLIPKGSRVNLFSYSIGAFLAQIIMMGNPGNLFSESKLFMLCGGSVFSNMHGTSKLIMDSLAYEKLYNYYMVRFEEEIKEKSPLIDFLSSSRLGMAFRSMIDLGRFRSFREKALSGLSDQLSAVGLLKDSVIPAKGIMDTLSISGKMPSYETCDFTYSYSHENPFPIHDNHLSLMVDESFEKIFKKASLFLR